MNNQDVKEMYFKPRLCNEPQMEEAFSILERKGRKGTIPERRDGKAVERIAYLTARGLA